ncbi:MAG: phytanoyl-CoA dioxygenase [Hellea sp.]|nr:phytanoyl-CoA dioxygenase [Hellea sp.]
MTKDISKSIEACAAHYGDDADAVKNYLIEGQAKALELPNRGPLKFDTHGDIHEDILEAYSKFGFYVLEGVISDVELNDIRSDLDKIRDNFPIYMGADKDKHGRPALGSKNKSMTLQWARPLSDPLGGTQISNGRHQVKLFEPKAAIDAPPAVPVYLSGSLQFSPACLRVYAHPDLLKLAETLNGQDFVPFTEGLFIKDAGLGAAVSWHQDGDTHWGSPNFDENIHGFNFMGQIYGSTAVNGVWVVPGSHKHDRADIVSMVEKSGCERLVDAVPIICNPGDVVINNRQVVHGSFANTGFETRVTVNFGFHKRSSVLNVKGAGIHAEAKIMDSEYINKRSEVIALAINARKKRFPNETPFNYIPLSDNLNAFDWNESSMAELKDYNLMDLSI